MADTLPQHMPQRCLAETELQQLWCDVGCRAEPHAGSTAALGLAVAQQWAVGLGKTLTCWPG